MEDFKIRAYGKSELALLYFPGASSTHTAVNHLMAWVKRNPALVAGLAEAGYARTAKYFTSREVRLIVDAIGPP